jgi:hypothetical protein
VLLQSEECFILAGEQLTEPKSGVFILCWLETSFCLRFKLNQLGTALSLCHIAMSLFFFVLKIASLKPLRFF